MATKIIGSDAVSELTAEPTSPVGGDEPRIEDTLLVEIRAADLDNLTPVQALNLVHKWKQDLRRGR